jgi:hypothetical protein
MRIGQPFARADINPIAESTFSLSQGLWFWPQHNPNCRILSFHFSNCRFRPQNLFSESVLRAVLRIRDVYPGSWFLPIPDPGSRIPDPGYQIPDPKTATKERGEKYCCHTLFVATNFTKLKIILCLNCWKKNLGQFSKNLCKKFSLSSQKYGFGIRDPGSEIRKKPIPGPGSRIRIRNTAYEYNKCLSTHRNVA